MLSDVLTLIGAVVFLALVAVGTEVAIVMLNNKFGDPR